MQKLFFIGFLLLGGCTYTKPVITEIEQDHQGNLKVEKCTIKYSPFAGISSENCTHYKI